MTTRATRRAIAICRITSSIRVTPGWIYASRYGRSHRPSSRRRCYRGITRLNTDRRLRTVWNILKQFLRRRRIDVNSYPRCNAAYLHPVRRRPGVVAYEVEARGVGCELGARFLSVGEEGEECGCGEANCLVEACDVRAQEMGIFTAVFIGIGDCGAGVVSVDFIERVGRVCGYGSLDHPELTCKRPLTVSSTTYRGRKADQRTTLCCCQQARRIPKVLYCSGQHLRCQGNLLRECTL